ncbi:hypothetical protein HNY73_015833 [Argiope bruennichi]|uniref:Helitron helicase-like domain-containing protein n=1 Tax=Argiope bruennichi TaxID=94029 RepID=A0A8T0EH98_ARGBR|nr:hypothetical protein HNY73_015833 [Argiope bruennichi]
MYVIEWQKRGFPYAHILIWLKTKIHAAQIDDVISAEIPNPEDQLLFDIVTKTMVHGSCGAMNPESLCILDNKCSKKFPRELVHETSNGDDRCPQYRCRKPEDGSHTTTIRMRNIDVEIDNRWIVTYSPLLSKAFKAHINVEYCHSAKSIKCICKYINKGNDMALVSIDRPDARNDEVSQSEMLQFATSLKHLPKLFGVVDNSNRILEASQTLKLQLPYSTATKPFIHRENRLIFHPPLINHTSWRENA